MRRHSPLILVVVGLLALVIGCGGGGGGGGNPPNPEFTPQSIQPQGNVDLLNLQPGDTVQLVIAGIDKNGDPATKPGSNWSTNAPNSVLTISNAGLVTAVATSANNYTITGYYGSKKFTTSVGVHGTQDLATVKGQARTSGGAAVPGAIIVFLDRNYTQVGSAKVASDGSFTAKVPARAKYLATDVSQITGYLPYFWYKGHHFNSDVLGCYAILPVLTVGETITLPSDVIIDKKTGGPPPPPPGCFNG